MLVLLVSCKFDQGRMASSSKVKGKSKKVPASKERAEFVVNPDEPVHDNLGKLPPMSFTVIVLSSIHMSLVSALVVMRDSTARCMR